MEESLHFAKNTYRTCLTYARNIIDEEKYEMIGSPYDYIFVGTVILCTAFFSYKTVCIFFILIKKRKDNVVIRSYYVQV